MPATDREAFVLGILDGLATDAATLFPARSPDADPGGFMDGYVCAVNTARGLLRAEIANDDQGDDEYVEVPGIGGAKPTGRSA
jgi:hypothetical protein